MGVRLFPAPGMADWAMPRLGAFSWAWFHALSWILAPDFLPGAKWSSPNCHTGFMAPWSMIPGSLSLGTQTYSTSSNASASMPLIPHAQCLLDHAKCLALGTTWTTVCLRWHLLRVTGCLTNKPCIGYVQDTCPNTLSIVEHHLSCCSLHCCQALGLGARVAWPSTRLVVDLWISWLWPREFTDVSNQVYVNACWVGEPLWGFQWCKRLTTLCLPWFHACSDILIGAKWGRCSLPNPNSSRFLQKFALCSKTVISWCWCLSTFLNKSGRVR